MPTVELPARLAIVFQEQAARLFDSRKHNTEHASLARQLLSSFFDLLTNTGNDRALDALEAPDASALSEREPLVEALVAQLGTIDLDGGGPRNAKPKQLADCTFTALGVTLVEEADRAIALDGNVKTALAAAIASVVDVELGVPKIRESVIDEGRKRASHPAYDKIAAQLDASGMQLIKTPKVPLDALTATRNALAEARLAIIDRVGRAAIDRAKAALEAVSPEAAARIDQPITLKTTPREVAILRAQSPRVGKTPGLIGLSLIDSLTDLIPIAWQVATQPAQPYAASKTFAIGDVVDHPKFGRGTVIARKDKRIEVEFSEGKFTLVHVAART